MRKNDEQDEVSRLQILGLFREMAGSEAKAEELCLLTLGLETSVFRHPSSLHQLADSGKVLPLAEERLGVY